MEIRCSQCQHVGPAADVRPTDDGVVLICANCGFENQLDVSKPKADTAEGGSDSAPADRPRVTRKKPPADETKPEDAIWLKQGALDRLVPEPGAGPRCRKCVQLLADGERFCPRCGLAAAEGERFTAGQAPWEKPPPEKEAEHEQASLLWKSVEEDPTDENVEKFAEFVHEEDLLEYGVRQLRRFLVEHPDNETAINHLRELASSFQARIVVAQAKAQIRADDFVQKTGKFKQILLWSVFIVWGAIFFAFLVNVADGCA